MLIMFNNECTAWSNDKDFNKMFLEHTIDYLNTKLSAIGWLSLNDLNDALGRDKKLEDQLFGWKTEGGLGVIEYEFVAVDCGTNNVVISLKNMVKLM